MRKIGWMLGVFGLLVFSSATFAIPYTFQFTAQDIIDTVNGSGSPTLDLTTNGIWRFYIKTTALTNESGAGYTLTSNSISGLSEWNAFPGAGVWAGFADDPAAPTALITENGGYSDPVPTSALFTLNIDSESAITGPITWRILVDAYPITENGLGDTYRVTGAFLMDLAPGLRHTDSAPPVPEPATLVLCGAGLAAMIAVRRKVKVKIAA